MPLTAILRATYRNDKKCEQSRFSVALSEQYNLENTKSNSFTSHRSLHPWCFLSADCRIHHFGAILLVGQIFSLGTLNPGVLNVPNLENFR